MTNEFALTLHNEDEVTIVETNTITRVLNVFLEDPSDPNSVIVECEDGNTYYPDELS